MVRVPRDLGSVTRSNVTEDGAQQINRVSSFLPLSLEHAALAQTHTHQSTHTVNLTSGPCLERPCPSVLAGSVT